MVLEGRIFMKTKKNKKESFINTLLVKRSITKHDLNPAIATIRIIIVYLTMGILWILLSDKLLEVLVDDPAQIAAFQLYKGWFYVVATSGIFYLIIKSKIDLFKITIDKMEESYKQLDGTYSQLKDLDLKLRNQFDISEQMKKDLLLSDQRYELAASGSNDGIWDWNILTGEYYISDGWKETLGFHKEFENSFSSWLKQIHPADLENVQKHITTYLSRTSGQYESTFRVQRSDGEYIWILSKGKAVWDESGKAYRMAGSHTDITRQKELEEQLYEMTYYDALTGLPNFYMLEKSMKLLLESIEENQRFAFVFFDVDNFKHINDIKGHAAGDQVLLSVADILNSQLKDPDFVARTGGDEFVLIMFPKNEEFSIKEEIEKIIHTVREAWIFGGQEFFLSFSVGVAMYPDHGRDFLSLLQNADTAMYISKEKGKDQISFYNSSMRQKTVEFIEMDNMMRNAIDNNEFHLNFQPQVDIKTNKIVGLEVLLRWKQAEKGNISPLEFIPFAEQTGMILKITECVFEKAFAQLVEWKNKGFDELKISINLSPKLLDEKLIDQIKHYMEVYKLTGSDFELEITETAIVEDVEKTFHILNELRKLHIRIALDDFGTGYSSLTYLQKLPIDILKIDRSLIKDMLEKENEIKTLKSVVELSHTLGLKVVAEGVETKEQLDVLKKINCDFVQGYYLYRPQLAEDIEHELIK